MAWISQLRPYDSFYVPTLQGPPFVLYIVSSPKTFNEINTLQSKKTS